jgi:hypothetical protein
MHCKTVIKSHHKREKKWQEITLYNKDQNTSQNEGNPSTITE